MSSKTPGELVKIDATGNFATGSGIQASSVATVALQTFSNADVSILPATRYASQIGTMSSPRTATLPAANSVAAGTTIIVTDASGTVTPTNKISVARAGSDTINGLSTAIVIQGQYGGVAFVTDGTSKWTAYRLIPTNMYAYYNGSATVIGGLSTGGIIFDGNGNNGSYTFAISYNGTLAVVVTPGASRFNLSSGVTLGFGNGNSESVTAGIARPASSVIEINNGTLNAAGGTLRSVPLSPAQITANQNDYAPGVAMFYRLNSDASRNITGLSCSQVDGQLIESICNVGSNNIVLKNQDVGSTAANRFICTGGADITLAANEEARAWYDGTTSRWRVRKL